MQVSFGQAVVIKTKNPDVVNTLEHNDCAWRNNINPYLKFEHLTVFGPDEDGFLKGILCNKEEKDALQGVEKLVEKSRSTASQSGKNRVSNIFLQLRDYIVKEAKTVEVSSVGELEFLPILEGVKIQKSD